MPHHLNLQALLNIAHADYDDALAQIDNQRGQLRNFRQLLVEAYATIEKQKALAPVVNKADGYLELVERLVRAGMGRQNAHQCATEALGKGNDGHETLQD